MRQKIVAFGVKVLETPDPHRHKPLAPAAKRRRSGGYVAAGGYWFLAHRGMVRWLAFGLVILVPIAVLVVFALQGLIWVAVVSVALLVLAAGAARRALAPAAADPGMPVREAPPPQRAFLIMNPRSGGGKVTKFALKEKGEALVVLC